jgi:Flp pilus assembly protein TadG
MRRLLATARERSSSCTCHLLRLIRSIAPIHRARLLFDATVAARRHGRHDRPVRMKQTEQGAVTVLVGVAMVLVAWFTLFVIDLGAAATDRARAQTAADAAALAGVLEGREGADELAQANDGRLVNFVDADDEVEVRVEVGQATATARAARTETPPFS